jgi:hypothetical protein
MPSATMTSSEVCLRGIFTASSEAAADGLLYKRSPSFDPLPHFADKVEIKRPRAEQSNTSILDAILKAFRRLENGIHPEVEVGTFLTDTARFPNVPHLLGIIEHRLETDERVVLCVLQRLVENSTDGWNYVAGELGRLSDRAAPNEPTARLLSVAQKDRTLLLMINAHHETVPFALPSVPGGKRWRLLIDTNEAVEFHRPISQAGGVVDVSGRSLALWELQPLNTFASDQDESSE